MDTNKMDTSKEKLSDWGIPGTYVFDGTHSRLGHALNRLAYSLTNAANREAFQYDEEGYMARYSLTEPQKDAIRHRDWLALVKEHGGNIYYLYKLGAACGQGLYHIGAQMRGETYEQFLQSRTAKGAR
jgi:protocatechuate 4,5-dioxygenase alpha chain